jgi:predicted nucleic acid-binding protein
MNDKQVNEQARFFLDTNVLIYSWSEKDKPKGRISRALVQKAFASKQGVVSMQVLQEFFSVATTKLGGDKLVVKEVMLRFAELPIVQTDTVLLKTATDISILSQLSIWDALIVAAAERAHCPILYSEDLSNGQSIRGVRISNPFLREA